MSRIPRFLVIDDSPPPAAYHGLLAPHAGWRAAIVPAAASGDAGRAPASSAERPPMPGRLSWATLLRRVFAIQILVCPHCGGARRILGAVTEPHAVRRLLAALGLAAEPPPGPAVPAA